MLVVKYIAETENDTFSPISVANALIRNEDMLSADDLEDIAEHLLIYVKRCRFQREEIGGRCERV